MAKENLSNFNDYTCNPGAKWKSENKAKYIHGCLKLNTLMKNLIFT